MSMELDRAQRCFSGQAASTSLPRATATAPAGPRLRCGLSEVPKLHGALSSWPWRARRWLACRALCREQAELPRASQEHTHPGVHATGLKRHAALPTQQERTPHRVELAEWTAPANDEYAWTGLIMAAQSPDELQRILTGLYALNVFHLTAAFSKLASFGRRAPARGGHATRPAAQRMLPVLIVRARENLARLQSRPLAIVAHCVGTFQHKDKELMADIAFAAEHRLASFTTQGLCNLLWGFARVDIQPSHRWMDGYLRAVQAQILEFKPQELSVVLWSLARLKFRLTPGKLHDFLQHVHVHLSDYSPHSLSNVLWSLATSEQRPEATWLAEVSSSSGLGGRGGVHGA